jgi:pilus assembly protein Flp/PilA
MRACFCIPAIARRFLRSQDGPSAVEYAVLLGLIVLTAAAAIAAVGSSVQGLWSFIHVAVNTTG